MGHQLARAAVAAALTAAVACGGGDGADEPPPVLDNARELAAQARTATTLDDPPAAAAVDELPPPDPSTFVGANRVVNLVAADDVALEVWSARTIETGPLLLADGVGFGAASDWFAVPPESELVVVRDGAGPDGVVVARLLVTGDGERLTTFLVDGEAGVDTTDLWEVGERGLAPPEPGRALIVVVAPNTAAFREELRRSVGSDSFYVGDGTGACHEQRVERDGFQAEVLGGDSVVEIATRTGPTTLTLHPWPSPDGCASPAVATFGVDVEDLEAVALVVHTRDGSSLDGLFLPLGLEPGTP